MTADLHAETDAPRSGYPTACSGLVALPGWLPHKRPTPTASTTSVLFARNSVSRLQRARLSACPAIVFDPAGAVPRHTVWGWYSDALVQPIPLSSRSTARIPSLRLRDCGPLRPRTNVSQAMIPLSHANDPVLDQWLRSSGRVSAAARPLRE